MLNINIVFMKNNNNTRIIIKKNNNNNIKHKYQKIIVIN